MLEICVSGFVIVSFAISILLWRALAVAKQADDRIYGISDVYHLEPTEQKFRLTPTLPSGND